MFVGVVADLEIAEKNVPGGMSLAERFEEGAHERYSLPLSCFASE